MMAGDIQQGLEIGYLLERQVLDQGHEDFSALRGVPARFDLDQIGPRQQV
jgi:hypothetical protein